MLQISYVGWQQELKLDHRLRDTMKCQQVMKSTRLQSQVSVARRWQSDIDAARWSQKGRKLGGGEDTDKAF